MEQHIKHLAETANAGLAPEGKVLLQGMEIPELLVCSVFFRRHWSNNDGNDPGLAHRLSDVCMDLALQRLWQVFLEDDEVIVQLLQGYAHILLYIFGRPFLSLSLLQASEPALGRFVASVAEPWVCAQ
jgi:hypothetical protein